MFIEEWVSVCADETIIITGSNEFLIFGHGARVDMGTITTWWEDTLNIPSKFTGLIRPNSSNGVGSTGWISLLGTNVEEQKFVSTTDGSDETSIGSPIDSSDEGTVTGQLDVLFVGFGVDEVNSVIVGTNGEMFGIWGENHGFDPFSFLDFLEQCLFDVIKRAWNSLIDLSPVDISDSNNTFVVSDSEVLKGIIICNASGLLVGWLTGHGRSSTFETTLLLLLLLRRFVDDTFSEDHLGLWVVC